MHRNRVFILAGLLPSSPLLTTGLFAQEPAAEQVTLSFAWPVGMTSGVAGAHARIRVHEGNADSSGISFSYNLEVQESERGLLIQCTDFQLAGRPPGFGMDVLPGILGALSPDYEVSREGELLAVAGLDRLVAEMRAFVYDSLDVSDSPQLRAIMDEFLSEEVLMTQLATEWNALVGNWLEAELELGAAYEYEAEEPIPLLGGQPVLYRYELGVADRVPCTDTDTEVRCVELIQRSRPDPEAMRALLETFARRLVEQGAGVLLPAFQFKDLDIEFEIVVVTEPSTLIPHSLSIYQQTEMTVEAEGEQQTVSETRIREYRYIYPTAGRSGRSSGR